MCAFVQRRALTHRADFHSVVFEDWCYNPGLLCRTPQQLLVKQPRPFLFFDKQQFLEWIHEGRLRQDCIGAPAPLPRYIEQDLPFNVNDATTYEKSSSPCPWPNGPIRSVSKASEVLYNLNPDVVDRILAAGAMILECLKTSLQVSTAFVAHTILHASQHVCSAVLVRIVAGQSATSTSIF